MAEIDVTNISNLSISTPSSGVTAIFVDTDKKPAFKNDSGTNIKFLDLSAQSIVTAAGTTTLLNTSPQTTFFTGSTTQTCVLPDATTLVVGYRFRLENNSTGAITVQKNGGGALWIIAATRSLTITLSDALGGTAGNWDTDYFGTATATGKSLTVNNSLTLAGTDATTMTFPSASSNVLTEVSTDQGANRVTNKDLDAGTTKIVDGSDTTKKIGFTVSGNTTGIVTTIASAQSTAQTLNIPNIAASSIIITDTLAQTIAGVKTMTNMTAAAGTATIPSMTLTTAGTLMTSPTAGVVEADSAAFYITQNTTNGRNVYDNWNFFRLTANGSAANPITDFFGSNDGIPTVLNGVYEIEWHCYFAIAALGGTLTWTITNTQTTTNMVAHYVGSPVGGMAAVGTPQTAGVVTQTAAIVALPITGTLTITTNHYHKIVALIEAATAGNVRLRFTCGTTTTCQPLRDSYFKVRRLPAGNAGTFVA